MSSEAVVAEVVREAIGVRCTSVESIPTDTDADVWQLQSDGGRIYLKAAPRSEVVEVEAWSYRRAGELGVPGPAVLHVDTSRKLWPQPFLVTSAVPGVDAHNHPPSRDDLRTILSEVADHLRTLHYVKLKRFGDLQPPSEPDGDAAGWAADHPTYVRALLDWGLPYVRAHGLLDTRIVDAAEEVVLRNDELVEPPDQGVFIHGDLWLGHVHYDPDKLRVTGLLDYDAASSDPAMDLGTFGYRYPDELSSLLTGYRATIDDLELKLDLYGLARSIGSLRWDHEHGWEEKLPPLREYVRRTAGRLHALLTPYC